MTRIWKKSSLTRERCEAFLGQIETLQIVLKRIGREAGQQDRDLRFAGRGRPGTIALLFDYVNSRPMRQALLGLATLRTRLKKHIDKVEKP